MNPFGKTALALVAGLIAKQIAESGRRTPADRMFAPGRRPRPPKFPRKPPEAGLPVPAVPPKGPLPMQGGAEAPLEFGD